MNTPSVKALCPTGTTSSGFAIEAPLALVSAEGLAVEAAWLVDAAAFFWTREPHKQASIVPHGIINFLNEENRLRV